MSITILKAGVQTTLQGSPYSGHRHIGMPAAGAADSLNLAFANRLVGKKPDDLAIEITLTAMRFIAGEHFAIALTGAASYFRVNAAEQALHRSVALKPNDLVEIGPANTGCRSYCALSAELKVDSLLNGQSTYLPARLGGFQGRALKDGDELSFAENTVFNGELEVTPDELRIPQTNGYLLRLVVGPEFHSLNEESSARLCSQRWVVSARSNRMGLMLEGDNLNTDTNASMISAPVFPGTIQCPPDGRPFLLGPDAQTTGGYPRIAQVIRADRHLLGQLKPDSNIQFALLSPQKATKIYRDKLALLRPWLGTLNLW